MYLYRYTRYEGSKEGPRSKERLRKSSDKDLKRQKGISGSRSSNTRSRSRSRSIRKKRDRSQTPKLNKIGPRIHLGRLTRNVTKDHVHEIFSNYGK